MRGRNALRTLPLTRLAAMPLGTLSPPAGRGV
jgi:hypothetical protein